MIIRNLIGASTRIGYWAAGLALSACVNTTQPASSTLSPLDGASLTIRARALRLDNTTGASKGASLTSPSGCGCSR